MVINLSLYPVVIMSGTSWMDGTCWIALVSKALSFRKGSVGSKERDMLSMETGISPSLVSPLEPHFPSNRTDNHIQRGSWHLQLCFLFTLRCLCGNIMKLSRGDLCTFHCWCFFTAWAEQLSSSKARFSFFKKSSWPILLRGHFVKDFYFECTCSSTHFSNYISHICTKIPGHFNIS